MRKKVNYFLILIPLFLFIINIILNFLSDLLLRPAIAEAKEKVLCHIQSLNPFG